jgi:hypothetical protein
VKTILHYIVGTLEYGLRYGWRTGTTGLVGWQSLKQRVVALPSCKAEYIVATTAATQAIWMARLLGELLGKEPEVVELKVDSKSALALARNPVYLERSKHVDLMYHFF